MRHFIITALALMAGVTVSAQMSLHLGKGTPLRKMQMAEIAINNLYVDSVDEDKLAEDAIRGMLEKLDPHSSYSTAKEVKSMNESLQGNFEGIGVQFNIVEDTLLVIQTVSGGPSEKAGLLAGDRIVTVNDTAVAGVKMSREEIMRRLRGPKGTKVCLGIARRGMKDLIPFTVTRDKIPVKTIDAVYMIRPGVGYIRISSFGATTYDEFMEGVKTLKAKGMNDLILDLQENGGGYLQAAVNISNEFLAEGDLIVYTSGRANGRNDYYARGLGRLRSGKVVVLVNEFSASAAEIVTGAIQDQDRGTVVGRRTFGKGLVQRPIPFDDGSMMRLTTAHYYTPSGRCIQKPYEKGQGKDYAKDLDNRLKHGEFMNADSIHFADSLKCYTLRKHRTVYGGGGIMPDYFVPLDTTKYSKMYRQFVAKNLIVNNSLKYIDNNRRQLRKTYASFDDFMKSFTTPQKLVDDIIADAEKAGLKPQDDPDKDKTLAALRLQLKALVARDIWDMSEYYHVINEDSEVVKKALEVINE